MQGKVAANFVDSGEQSLKNIARPVRVYRVELGEGSTTPTTPPALALPDKPSIAVLPFQNMSGDPEQEYFADGIVEDIITALARMPWLFVIARNSSFSYKGRAVDLKQVGRDLGVRYVLEGACVAPENESESQDNSLILPQEPTSGPNGLMAISRTFLIFRIK